MLFLRTQVLNELSQSEITVRQTLSAAQGNRLHLSTHCRLPSRKPRDPYKSCYRLVSAIKHILTRDLIERWSSHFLQSYRSASKIRLRLYQELKWSLHPLNNAYSNK
jgi:hypothetical protein